jgi:transcriptional regulator with XRE-family HTH domain
MKYNYCKLLGKIKECGFTQSSLADAIKINRGTLSAKLNGQYPFSTKDIDSICKELNISNDEIGAYFFTK